MDIRSAIKGTTPQATSTPPVEKPSVTPLENEKHEETFDGNVLLQEYMKFLEENDVTKEDVLALLETLITSGDLEWSDALFNGRIPLRFRIRSAWIEDIIAKRLDTMSGDNNLSMARFSGMIRMLNVAGSMTRYNDREVDIQTDEDFQKAFEFVEKLPYPILAAIGHKLAIFDRAVAVAMSDWALKNFTEPQKESS